MSTAPELHNATLNQAENLNQADDFQALEERVMRLVELVRGERRERAKAEENAATLQQLLEEQGAQLARTEEELRSLSSDRDQVRNRVERLLKQLDDLG